MVHAFANAIFCDYEWMYAYVQEEGKKKKKDYGLRISEISRDSCSLEGETHDRKSSRSSFVSTQMEIRILRIDDIHLLRLLTARSLTKKD